MNIPADYFFNGQGSGDVASVLMQHNGNPAALRPFNYKGKSYITLNEGLSTEKNVLISNAPATMTKDAWIQLDTAIIKAAKPRLQAWGDLMGMGLRYNIPNGMARTVLQHQDMSDISEAVISMDGMRRSDSDRPELELRNLPLPIISKDFHFHARELMASRQGGAPLDTTTAELAGRRVAEEVEKLLLGVSSSYTYGGGSVYGYTNFPSRLTKTVTAPASWTSPADLVEEVLEMIEQARAKNHFGPFVLYFSPSWDAYLDADYSASKGDNTLRERLMKIRQIEKVETLDYLPTNTTLLVERNSDVVRGIVGMDITTLQWQTHGGMMYHFKVMCICVPQLRTDYNSQTGIVHGSHA